MTKPVHINKEIQIIIPSDSNDINDDIKEGIDHDININNNTIERIWAYLQLKEFAKKELLYNDMIEIDDDEQKEDDILPLTLAMKYKFVTPWTSMIVVKQKEGNPNKKKRKKKKQKPPKIVTDRKGALVELKKKRQLEQELMRIQGKKLNLETQIMTLEDAHLNKETLKAMKTSASAMKSTIKESDLDKSDELMEDINEAMDQVCEMNDAMQQPLGQIDDDDDLEAELAELEELEADEIFTEMSDDATDDDATYDAMDLLPCDAVPAEKIIQAEAEEEEEEEEDEEDELADYGDEKKQDIIKDKDVDKEIKRVIEAYNDKNIRITFEISKTSTHSNVCNVLVTFYNKSEDDMDDFKFVVNVEQYIKLEMGVLSGGKLLKQSGNVITQRFKLNNTKNDNKSIMVNFQVTYTSDSTQQILKSVVKISV